MEAVEAVLETNRRYYEAFEARDLDAMSDLWERSARAVCTHPGWATLTGWGRVSASFFALFQSGQQLQFVLTREQATVVGDAAWVTLDENLLGDQGGVTVATTNVFVRRNAGQTGGDQTGGGQTGGGRDDSGADGHAGDWALVCHHGSVVQAGLEDLGGGPHELG